MTSKITTRLKLNPVEFPFPLFRSNEAPQVLEMASKTEWKTQVLEMDSKTESKTRASSSHEGSGLHFCWVSGILKSKPSEVVVRLINVEGSACDFTVPEHFNLQV